MKLLARTGAWHGYAAALLSALTLAVFDISFVMQTANDAARSGVLTGLLILLNLTGGVACWQWLRLSQRQRLSERSLREILQAGIDGAPVDADRPLTQLAESLVQQRHSDSERLCAALQLLQGLQQQVAAASMAGQSSQQQAALQQACAAVEQISGGAQEIVDLVAMISESTLETLGSIEGASNKVNQTSAEITTQAQHLDAVENTLQRVGNQVAEIAGFLSVIEEIADQTNLLALNAAIEAARAGEQGRGFAVVADEVRSLAKKTRDATDSITRKIEDLNRSSEHTGQLMSQARSALQQSSAEVGTIGEVMSEISAAFSVVNEMMASVTSSCEQEFGSIQQITTLLQSLEGEDASARVLAQLQQSMATQV